MSKSMRYRAVIGSGLMLLAVLIFSVSDARSASSPSAQGAVCQLRPQEAPIPSHAETRVIRSGRHTAAHQDSDQPVFSTLVQNLDAPWLQVNFGETNLGHNSYMRLTSVSDGAVQKLDADTLATWHNQSAMFNGDAIKIELFAAPDDGAVFFDVKFLTVGDWVGGVPLHTSRPMVAQLPSADPQQLDVTHYNPDMVCGADDRVASTDNAVGRVMPAGCTGWVVSNGAFLTAGHCVVAGMTSVQFNVPASNADGTINAPPPQDQFPINGSNIVSLNAGEGNDWAVFQVNRNATTGGVPPLQYGAYYRIKPQDQPATVRVTGYGVDGPAPCFGESRQSGCNVPTPTPVPRNADNQTQQTATGAGQGRQGLIFYHDVDITGGDSGAPVRFTDSPIAVAIHTHGTSIADCTTGHNGGTAFTNLGLANAVNAFPGTMVRYVDAGYPAWTTEDGTVFRPFNLLAEGITSITSGGIVSVVAGHYNEPLTIDKGVFLEAPVGTVVIGAP